MATPLPLWDKNHGVNRTITRKTQSPVELKNQRKKKKKGRNRSAAFPSFLGLVDYNPGQWLSKCSILFQSKEYIFFPLIYLCVRDTETELKQKLHSTVLLFNNSDVLWHFPLYSILLHFWNSGCTLLNIPLENHSLGLTLLSAIFTR